MASRYIKGKTLGEGTWGVVYGSTHKEDGTKVAIKRIRPTKITPGIVGVNFSALREIKYLKEIRHRFIVRLFDVYISDSALHLVFEYCFSDLEAVIKTRSIFLTPAHIKSYLSMMLQGLEHCHNRYILHRDLKPGNILLSTSGEVKLADFGLARFYGSPNRRLTATVVTSWYRAPELLFGASLYAGGVDIWAMGCILAELVLRAPLFPGTSDSNVEQLALIFNFFGTPVDSPPPSDEGPTSGNGVSVYWPGVSLLPNYIQFEDRPALGDHASLFSSQPSDLLCLFNRMMTLNPLQRISATEALQDRYFLASSVPQATPPQDLPLPPIAEDVASLSSPSRNSPPSKRLRGP